jgi:hypothetical protein
MKRISKISVFILCMVLIAAIALTTAGCSVNKTQNVGDTVSLTGGNIGTGEKSFTFIVVDESGKETTFTVNTDKEKVGEALLENKLIAGEMGDYGLYVKTVNGITADYDVSKTYWAFYENGSYAMTGVDATDIVDGSTYSFKIEK